MNFQTNPFLRGALIAVSLLLLALAAPTWASVREVSGFNPKLETGEGLVALVVDSDIALKSGTFARVGRGSAGISIGPIPVGRSVHWVAVTPESYSWTGFDVQQSYSYSRYFRFNSKDRVPFTARAGVINYPGDMVIRSQASLFSLRASFSRYNRMEDLMRVLDAAGPHPPLEFRGEYPDPYPAFIAELSQRKPQNPVTLPPTSPTWNPQVVRGLVSELFRPSETSWISLNRSGDLAIEQGIASGRYRLDLIDLNSGLVARIYDDVRQPLSVTWDDDRNVFVGFRLDTSRQRVVRTRVTVIPGQKPQVEFTALPFDGRILDTLEFDSEHVLFERWDASSKDPVQVVRLDVSGDAEDLGDRPDARRVDQDVRGGVAWASDARGNLRAALSYEGEHHVLKARSRDADKWREIARVPDDVDLWPVGVDADASSVFLLTNWKREQRELVRMAIDSGTIEETLLSVPGADLVNVVRSDIDGAPIGARHYDGGIPRTVFFDPRMQRLQASLEKLFPTSSVLLTDVRLKGRRALVVTEGDHEPLAYHLLDTERMRIEKLAVAAPWLEDREFTRGATLRTTSSDGLAIEGYLYVPQSGDGTRPLVVVPHGGPIGVRDARHFDPEVQLLASLGYAVLQVNYRGSSGFGRAFRDAGFGAVGEGIELDIDRLVDVALATGKIDRERICVAGSSYGGYSAVMAVIRSPQRYRCAASLAGVMDLPLVFTGGDTTDNDKAMAIWARVAGDPRKNLDQMMKLSPLYQVERITRPVLLANGTEDMRVSIEHAKRLKRALRVLGVDQSIVELAGEGHSLTSMHSAETYYVALAEFLDRNLKH